MGPCICLFEPSTKTPVAPKKESCLHPTNVTGHAHAVVPPVVEVTTRGSIIRHVKLHLILSHPMVSTPVPTTSTLSSITKSPVEEKKSCIE